MNIICAVIIAIAIIISASMICDTIDDTNNE